MATRSVRPTVWIEPKPPKKGPYRVRAEVNGRRLPDIPVGTSRLHAERVRDKLKADLWAGKLGIADPDQRTLGKFVEQYLEHARAHKAANTVKNFEEPALRSLLEHFGAEQPLKELGREDLEEWKMGMLNGGLAPQTVAMRLRSAKAALGHAVRLGAIEKNPGAGVVSPKTEAAGRVLLSSEIDQLLQRLPVIVSRAVWFDLNTGLRLSEILELDWRAIRRDREPWAAEIRGKGKVRLVHLNRASRAVMGTPAEAGQVFAGLSRHMIHSHLAAAARTLGLGRVRFHDLRHTWATEYMRRTGDLPGLMLEGGWSTLSAVKVYQHLSRARAAAVELVDFGIAPPALPQDAGSEGLG